MKRYLIMASVSFLLLGHAFETARADTYTKRNETVFFGGLQWNFGSSSPDAILGVRTTKSERNTSVYGAKFDVAIPIDSKRWNLPTVRLLGLGGDCHVQGEAGVGLNFATTSPIFALGIQAPYSTAGINYSVPNKFAPYIGVNSLRKPACAFKSAAAPVV